MALVVPDVGEKRLLDSILRLEIAAANIHTIHLFYNNYTPVAGTSHYNYFTEAAFSGYVGVTMTRSSWYSAVTNPSNEAECSYATFSWTCSGSGQTIYGYWVEDQDRTIMWAERFGTPRVVASGDILNLTPKFTLRSQ